MFLNTMFKLFISITILNIVHSSVIITRFDDYCDLDSELIKEIASYKNITDKIREQFLDNGFGATVYDELANFIDRFGARLAGSDVLENSIDYMVNITRQNGLNDVFTEDVKVPHWVRGHECAEMIEPRHKNIAILGFGTSVSTPKYGITAEVIVINSFDELNKTSKNKIKGKIVVFDAHFVSYGDTVIYRSQGASKASMKGAVATLVRSISPFSIYSPHTGAQYYSDGVSKIPTAAITHEDADLMRRLQNRGEKIVLSLKMFNTIDEKISRNTIIDLKGSKYPEKQVIVSGHIDSWDVGQGAMDDGGGMMISWMVPVLLNRLKFQPKRTIRAILWTAEEPGLVGAAAYLNKHIDELANINFIMESDEGTFQPLGLDFAGSKRARCIIKEILKVFTPVSKITESGSPGSDITMFIQKGVPGASLLNKNERYYWFHHSEGDTMNVENANNVLECASFWASFAYVVADLSQDIPRD